ncbi:TlpA family protein disulfide reductase [Calditrichota bacterium GD2]
MNFKSIFRSMNYILLFISIFLLIKNFYILKSKVSDDLSYYKFEIKEKNFNLQYHYFLKKIPAVNVYIIENGKKLKKNTTEIFKNNEITILFYNSNINCSFCLKELTKWKKYFEINKYRNIKFYVIVCDIGFNAYNLFAQKVGLICPVIYDKNNVLKNFLQIVYSPTIFLVNKNNKIIYSFSSYLNKSSPDSFFKNVEPLN